MGEKKEKIWESWANPRKGFSLVKKKFNFLSSKIQYFFFSKILISKKRFLLIIFWKLRNKMFFLMIFFFGGGGQNFWNSFEKSFSLFFGKLSKKYFLKLFFLGGGLKIIIFLLLRPSWVYLQIFMPLAWLFPGEFK